MTWIWVRHVVLIIGGGVLSGWLWTVLAPQPPVNGGILFAAGVLTGVACGGAVSVAWEMMTG